MVTKERRESLRAVFEARDGGVFSSQDVLAIIDDVDRLEEKNAQLRARVEAAETYAWHNALECHCDVCVSLDDIIRETRGGP